MSDLLDRIRENYPQYEDVPDEYLTVAIGRKYPVYLSQDENFKKEFERITTSKEPVIPRFQPRNPAITPLESTPEEHARFKEEMASPIAGAGKGFSTIGKSAVAALGDLGNIFFRPVTEQLYPEQATNEPIPPENLRAVSRQEPLPAKDLRVLGKPLEITGGAAQGLVETTPKLAAVAALEAGGIPAPVGAAAVFGTTEQGFDPKQAAVAAALPFVGKYSGKMVEALASKLGVNNETALGVFNKLGGAAGAAGYLTTIDESEIANLPPEQRDQARINSWANVAGQAALGMMGGKPNEKGEPNATQKGQQSESSQPEHIGTEAQRVPAETVSGNSPEQRGVEQPTTQAQPNVPTEVKPSGNRVDALDLAEQTKPEAPKESPNQIQLGRPTGGGLKLKWAEATNPNVGEAGFINIDPLKDLFEGIGRGVKASIEAVRQAGKEALDPKRMNDYRRSVLNWSGSLQKSYQEAFEAQKEIREKVKDPFRRDGITNWIQAGGDKTVLAARAAATTDPKLKKGYEAALNLTPEEIAVANDVKAAYDALGKRGQHYDVLNNFRDNYVTQIWDLKKGPTGGASSRTLRDKFRFARARTFDSFFDGEQAGFKPKTKDISKILPAYIHEMNSVIAARQLVQQMGKGVASDGRPLLAPRGTGASVDNGSGDKATLIMPNSIKGDTGDYKTLDSQPALSGWRWAAKDDAGNPVFLKGDLAIHPEVYDKLKNVLGKSAIKEWYDSKGSFATAIPKAIVKAIDVGQGEIKRTMLGFFAPFHQVQEGTHAIGHRVNPIAVTRGGLVDRATGGKLPDALTIPKIDLVNNPAHADAAKHGLMLQPDRATQETFMDGFRHSGLVSRIPGIGPAADFYSHYLFHEYIPGLKLKTYEAILERNKEVFAKDLASGKVKPEDVKVISAEQANAAYGHLNYADLGRNPTILHLMRLGLLAPDFLEARARFVGQSLKGITGSNVGREQVLALATLAISQTALAYIGAKLTGGDWDAKHPFEFTSGNRRYSLRSVPEDVYRLMTGSRAFIYARLNPTTTKNLVQGISGVDWRGQKVTPLQTLKEAATQPIPLTARGFLGIGNTPLSSWEQLAGAVGLKISRYSPQTDVYKMVDDFKKNSGNAKLVAEYERRQKETYADSDYKPLRVALEKGDAKEAETAYAELLKTKKASDIEKAMRPYTMTKILGSDAFEKRDKPFTGSRKFESAFVQSLNSSGKQTYERAKQEREQEYRKFKEFLKGRKSSE